MVRGVGFLTMARVTLETTGFIGLTMPGGHSKQQWLPSCDALPLSWMDSGLVLSMILLVDFYWGLDLLVEPAARLAGCGRWYRVGS